MIASLEYAVTVLGVRLLVVLGHQNCGAIKQVSKDYEALLHELTADAEDSLMAADSISDIDERICDSDSIMLRTVGFRFGRRTNRNWNRRRISSACTSHAPSSSWWNVPK